MKIAKYGSLNSLVATVILLNTSTTLAQTYQPSNRQPTADNSSIGTKVSPTGNNNFDITGGLSRGQTLFHSFSDFSIPTAGSTNFINPAGTRDIITRVTGNNYSDLNGRLNSNGANFFLINPNGVVFGANVKLNVGKAFVVSTANSIDLVDGSGRAITFGTNSNGDAPLLSIAPDVAFNVSRFNFSGGTGEIRNFGSLENYNKNPYVALIGGNITFDGRDGTGRIVAPTGRVDIGGLNGAGTVTIDDRGLVSSGNITWSDVSLLNGGHVYVLANQTVGTVDTFINNTTSPGSVINISANNVRLINDKSTPNTVKSYLGAGLTEYAGVNTATTGDININATGKVSLDNAEISNRIESGATGNIGNIKINAKSLSLNDQSDITSQINIGGTGNTGNIQIDLVGDLNISGTTDPNLLNSEELVPSSISNNIKGTGTAGKILIDAKGDISLANRGNIINSIDVVNTDESGKRVAGEALSGNRQGIRIVNARNLSLINRSNIQSSNYSGKGEPGNVDINITGDLNISGTVNASRFKDEQNEKLVSGITSGVNGIGNSGNINIQAKSLNMADISIIQANTYSGSMGNAGNVKIVTTGDINISGTNDPALLTGSGYQARSTIGSATAGKGSAGKIEIDTPGKVSLVNRGAIYNSIDKNATGEGRDLNITADNVYLSNFSYISAANDRGTGKTGNINVVSNRRVELDRKSSIFNSNFGLGESGNISINSDLIYLKDDSSIKAISENASGGNIYLNNRGLLVLRNNSNIATDANSFGRNSNGGNIDINSPLIVATPGNSNITANAYEGDGGRINIASKGLFGIAKRDFDSQFTNDITATAGRLGQSGSVNIDTPSIDPGKDRAELPNATIDASSQIDRACSSSTRENKLTVAGRGGLPATANEPLTTDVVWQDPRHTSSQQLGSKITTSPLKLAPPAVGWVFDGNGKVRLIAAGSASSPKAKIICPQSN